MKYTMAHNADEARKNFTEAEDATFPITDTIPQLIAISLDPYVDNTALRHAPLYIYRGHLTTPMATIKYYVWIDEPIAFGRGRRVANIGFDAVPAGASYPDHMTPWQRSYESAAECLEGDTEWKLFPVVGIWESEVYWDIELVK